MSTAVAKRPRAAQPEAKQFTAHVPFTKDAKASSGGVLSIKGYASTWSKDRDQEYVATDAFDGSWDAFISKNPMMLYQHNPNWPIGSFADGLIDEHGLFVDGNVPEPNTGEIPEVVTAYHKIDAGVLRTFSIGGVMWRQIKDADPVIVRVELMEISVVTIPANAESLFTVAKALVAGGQAGLLSDQARAQMEQLLGFRPLTDPELKDMTVEDVDRHWEALSELFAKSHGVAPPPRDAWLRVIRAKNGGVSLPVVAEAASEVVRSFYQPDAPSLLADPARDGKAGRVLSSANEQKLRDARDNIDGVLAQLNQQPRTDTPGTAGPAGDDADIWNDGDPLDSPTNPAMRAGPYSPERMAARTQARKARKAESYRDLMAALEVAVEDWVEANAPDAVDDDGWCYAYVADFTDTTVIFSVRGDTYQAAYTRDNDGNVTIAADAQEVRPQTTWVPTGETAQDDQNAASGVGRKAAPPNLRQAPPGRDSPECGNCTHFEADECAKYDTTVQYNDLCDSWEAITDEQRALVLYRHDLLRAAGASGLKAALSIASLPIAPRGQAWDAAAARGRVKDWSGAGDAPNDKYAQAFLWRDDDGSTFTEYRFIVADVIDGSLKYVPRAIFAAAAVVQGARGGTSGDIANAIRPKLDTLYARLAKEFDDDTITPPWSDA